VASLALRHAQAAVPQTLDKLPHGNRLRSGGDQPVIEPLWHVVVVEIESAAGDSLALGEGMQLLQRAVTDEMRPEHIVGWPPRLVYQYQVILQARHFEDSVGDR
jgi:hypothetical protein